MQAAFDTVVIGGGIAGLTVTYRLIRAGQKVVCLEADSRAGGCVRTDEVNGYLCERGAQNVLEEAGGPVEKLAQDLGIAGAIVRARQHGNFVASGGRLFSMPAELLRLLSFGGALRAARGLFARCAADDSDESVAQWACRRFGSELADRLIDPMVSGIYAGDPETLSLRATFPDVPTLEAKYRNLLIAGIKFRPPKRNVFTFHGGMGTVTESLAKCIGPALRNRVTASSASREPDGCYRIQYYDAGDGRNGQITARSLVVAVAAPIAASILAHAHPVTAQLLEAIHCAPIVSLSLALSANDFTGPTPAGYGMIAPYCEGARLLGCLFSSCTFENVAPSGAVLLRVLAGGRRDPAALRLSDRELAELALKEVSPVIHLRRGAKPLLIHGVRHYPGLPQYEVGHCGRVDAIEQATRMTGVLFAGNSYRGLSVSKVVQQAESLCEQVLRLRAAA